MGERGNAHKYSMPTDSLGKAIEYAARRDATILNLSVSTPTQLSSVEDALYNRANLLLVVAAGNSRVDLDQRPLYPAYLSSLDAAYRGRVISVAAHDRAGCLSAFSGRGKNSVDIAAPGVEIRSTVFNGAEELGEGTSQATALVSFVAAQLRSIGMDFAPAIKERLIASADLNAAMIGVVRSEGTLNAAKALDIYYDVIELAPTGVGFTGRLGTPLTARGICPGLSDTRKVIKVSRRIEDGPAGEVRLLIRSDDRGRLAVLHCVPTSALIPFTKSDGQGVTFRWTDVLDLVPAV